MSRHATFSLDLAQYSCSALHVLPCFVIVVAVSKAELIFADLMAGADIRDHLHANGSPHPMTGRWMPDMTLRNENRSTRVAELLRTARPILLDLANRIDLVAAAKGWIDRVDVVTVTTTDCPADAILIRPGGYVAWTTDPDTPKPADRLRHAGPGTVQTLSSERCASSSWLSSARSRGVRMTTPGALRPFFRSCVTSVGFAGLLPRSFLDPNQARPEDVMTQVCTWVSRVHSYE